MSTPVTIPPTTFPPAPPGTRVRVVSLMVFSVLVAAIAVVGVVTAGRPDAWLAVLGAASAIPLLAALWYGSRIRLYQVAEGELRVVRAFHTVRLPLDGLTSLEPDPAALAGAWKTIGNDGLGAISGRFRSRKLGAFRAYVTDPRNSVLLRWPDHCVVVSPEKPGPFVAWMRRHVMGKGER